MKVVILLINVTLSVIICF